MKVFVFALVLLSLMLALITYNYIYIHSASDELAAFAQSLTIDDTDRISELTALWEQRHPFISISTEETKEENISDLLSALLVYSKKGNGDEFEHTRALLVNAFYELAAFETFSIHDILKKS